MSKYVLKYLLVGIGCFFGANGRYIVEHYVGHAISSDFAVLCVNIVGCFIIGLLTAYVIKEFMHVRWSFLLATGFCGGFTTFSSFAAGLVKLMIAGDYSLVIAYAVGNMVLGMVAVYLGLWLVLHNTGKLKELV